MVELTPFKNLYDQTPAYPFVDHEHLASCDDGAYQFDFLGVRELPELNEDDLFLATKTRSDSNLRHEQNDTLAKKLERIERQNSLSLRTKCDTSTN